MNSGWCTVYRSSETSLSTPAGFFHGQSMWCGCGCGKKKERDNDGFSDDDYYYSKAKPREARAPRVWTRVRNVLLPRKRRPSRSFQPPDPSLQAVSDDRRPYEASACQQDMSLSAASQSFSSSIADILLPDVSCPSQTRITLSLVWLWNFRFIAKK